MKYPNKLQNGQTGSMLVILLLQLNSCTKHPLHPNRANPEVPCWSLCFCASTVAQTPTTPPRPRSRLRLKAQNCKSMLHINIMTFTITTQEETVKCRWFLHFIVFSSRFLVRCHEMPKQSLKRPNRFHVSDLAFAARQLRNHQLYEVRGVALNLELPCEVG